MASERLWERLVEYLDGWASAREVPGGIEVTFEQSRGVTWTVEVVVTSTEWDDYIGTIHGTGDPAATPLGGKILATADGARYLVYDRDAYDWEHSGTGELPEDDIDPGRGEWVVKDPDGSVIDRFASTEELD
ncbi:hypothetical protein [Nocardioides sp. SYSU DS0663]|uniref:hypothetical protein n=1 Tax=Nocardioides sp. SYSU DS0663 TaxID=3416445 RepID=UPI003F4C7C3B